MGKIVLRCPDNPRKGKKEAFSSCPRQYHPEGQYLMSYSYTAIGHSNLNYFMFDL